MTTTNTELQSLIELSDGGSEEAFALRAFSLAAKGLTEDDVAALHRYSKQIAVRQALMTLLLEGHIGVYGMSPTNEPILRATADMTIASGREEDRAEMTPHPMRVPENG